MINNRFNVVYHFLYLVSKILYKLKIEIMGWKSTIEITRKEAIQAIISSLDKTPYDEMTNEQLEDMMYQLDIGDDVDKPYYGYNFIIRNNEDEIDNS